MTVFNSFYVTSFNRILFYLIHKQIYSLYCEQITLKLSQESLLFRNAAGQDKKGQLSNIVLTHFTAKWTNTQTNKRNATLNMDIFKKKGHIWALTWWSCQCRTWWSVARLVKPHPMSGQTPDTALALFPHPTRFWSEGDCGAFSGGVCCCALTTQHTELLPEPRHYKLKVGITQI